MTHKAARAYGRVFFASAHDEVPDKQGRVTIPAHLREYAGLDRDVAVIGASSRVEIWDQAGMGDIPGDERGRVRRDRGRGVARRVVEARGEPCGRVTASPYREISSRSSAPDTPSPVPGASERVGIWRYGPARRTNSGAVRRPHSNASGAWTANPRAVRHYEGVVVGERHASHGSGTPASTGSGVSRSQW